jgi:deoxyribonuclease V
VKYPILADNQVATTVSRPIVKGPIHDLQSRKPAMKRSRRTHRWDLSPAAAIRLQKRLAAAVRVEPLKRRPNLVAGGDVSLTLDGHSLIAGWVLWDIERKAVTETAVEIRPATFPYVPGLLSFREAPALLAAARKLETKPDVLLLDGQGMAHPRRFGLACHIGLLMDRPAAGCAKSRLCGSHQEPGPRRGASRRLIHNGEAIGRVLRTRDGVNPIYISIGHAITLDDAVNLTLRCCGKYRLPEPTRLAHQLVTRRRKADDL